MPTDPPLPQLLDAVRACQVCAPHLDHAPRPVLQMGAGARILIAGQAPGRRVHESGVPFADASGDRLRDWLGIPREVFYDARQVAILPMGFCYPGRGTSGDRPPRPECAPLWRARLLAQLRDLQLTVVIGRYALDYHAPGQSLTDRVRNWRAGWPTQVVLPHPSPRNNPWLKRNPWFEAEVLPSLRQRVGEVLDGV